MKIVTLVENTKNDKELKAQHGLSFYIEYENHKILFDVGPSKAYIDNARKLGIDLSTVDTVIISHGHSDHSKGLKYLSTVNTKAKVYLPEKAMERHWLHILGMNLDVGIHPDWIKDLENRLIFVTQKEELFIGVSICPIEPTHKNIAPNLRKGMQKETDDFNHEMMLILHNENGIVVFSGCSHNGIVEMAKIAISLFPNTPITALIGGFHFIKIPIINNLGKTKEEIQNIAQTLADMPIEKVYSCHCTGPKGNIYLKEVLAQKLEVLSTGRILEL